MSLKPELIREVATFAGLASVFAGLWWMYPPAALVVVGAVVFLAAVQGYRQ